jgi:steroid delta-isomerase-like uncharacterized protein
MATPKEILQAWIDAFNAHDARGAAELYHDDAINIQVAADGPVQGKVAIFQDFAQFFRAFPDSYTRPDNIFEDGEWAIVEWTGGGTFLGEFVGIPPSGKKFVLRGCGFFHITDEKICFQRGYWDKVSWFKQLGIPVV